MRYRYYSTFSFRSCFCRVSSLNIYFSIFPSRRQFLKSSRQGRRPLNLIASSNGLFPVPLSLKNPAASDSSPPLGPAAASGLLSCSEDSEKCSCPLLLFLFTAGNGPLRQLFQTGFSHHGDPVIRQQAGRYPHSGNFPAGKGAVVNAAAPAGGAVFL